MCKVQLSVGQRSGQSLGLCLESSNNLLDNSMGVVGSDSGMVDGPRFPPIINDLDDGLQADDGLLQPGDGLLNM